MLNIREYFFGHILSATLPLPPFRTSKDPAFLYFLGRFVLGWVGEDEGGGVVTRTRMKTLVTRQPTN